MSILTLFVLTLLVAVQAADPDPLQDYCVADLNSTLNINGYECQDAKTVESSQFASQVLRNKKQEQGENAVNFIQVGVNNFPALNTLGLGIVRADLGPNGVVPLHIHPRSSELIYIEDGTVRVGFVSSDDKLHEQVLQKGDLFIVTRGLLHYLWNVGKGPATVVAVFNSQTPGTQILGTSIFSSKIPDFVLQSSFQVNKTIVDALTGAFS